MKHIFYSDIGSDIMDLGGGYDGKEGIKNNFNS